MVIVSACLLNVHCRFDGESRPWAEPPQEIEHESLLPVCPEQLGGLPTPRSPATIVGPDADMDGHDVLAGRAQLVNADGEDVTEQFLRGAREVLDLARRMGVRKAYLKSKSPSCGVGGLSDGEGGVRPGDGVTAALLVQHDIEIIRVP